METLRTILVTRAEPGASKTFNKLKEMGFLAEKIPAIHLAQAPITFSQKNFEGALIFTSQNGIQFAPRAPFRHAKKVFCVGDATAQSAHQAGFKNIHSARGDAQTLIEYIKDNWTKGDGPLLHMANASPRGDIVPSLKESGYDAEFMAVYKSSMHPEFETKLRSRLKMDLKLDVILVHSPMAADFIDLVLNDWRDLSNVNLPQIIAISPDAGKTLENLFHEKVFYAAKPNEISLLEQLKGS